MVFDARRLKGLLEQLEGLWRQLGMPVADTALPGATDDEIDAAIAPFELTLPEEAKTWFRWHNGADAPPWWREVAPGWHLLSLEEAAERYYDRPLPPSWPAGWFPLLRQDAATVAVDTNRPQPAHVYLIHNHAALPSDPPVPTFPSITDMVEQFITVLAYGWVEFNPEDGLRFTRPWPSDPDGVDLW